MIAMLEKQNWATRVAYFSWNTANHFLAWWFYYYSDDFSSNLASFHYDWIEALFSGKNVFIEGARGTIKTSLILKYVKYKICIKDFSFWVWQSFEDTSSTRNTTQIALGLMNKSLSADYGELFSIKWGRDELEKKSVGDFDTKNWVKILASSLGQKLRGAVSKNSRPELLILDDIDVTDSVRNPEVISKNYEKITGETIGAMSKQKNQIIFLGNTINQDWVVPRFRNEKQHDKNWVVFRQPLIVDDVIQWDFFTPEMIEKIRSNEGERAFNQNYLLIPLDVYWVGLVKKEWIMHYEHTPSIDDFDELFMHADTTHTGKSTSDYFALWVVGKNKKDNNFYMLDYVLEKMDVERQARNGIVMYQKFKSKVKRFTYDEKSNNWFWFWIKKLATDEYHISLPIEELKYPNDKVTHFEPHVPHFVANRMYFPANHRMREQADLQLMAFPTKWVNDDFVDLVSGCMDNFHEEKKEFFTWFF